MAAHLLFLVTSLCSRRTALLRAGAAAGAALLAPTRSSHAEGAASTASACFSAGDARFLQPAFDEIKYLGVQWSEVGSMRLAEGSSLPAIRVQYDPSRVGYKRIVGAFLRAVDPTAEGQFGAAGPGSVIWASTEAERADAAGALARLGASGLYRGRPIATEVRLSPDLSGLWAAGAEAEQGWYMRQPQAYAKARAQTGRERWFEQAFRPIKTTACDGRVCGYVLFPCTEDNGCLAVMNGSW